MRRINIACTITCVALVAFTLQSCKKSNGIINDSVISKPYSVHFSDTSGNMFYTNDGENFYNIAFGGGSRVDAIFGVGDYLMKRLKGSNQLFVSDGKQGKNVNFNPTLNNLAGGSFGNSAVLTVDGYVDLLGQKVNRVFACTDLGVQYNDSNARNKTRWTPVGDTMTGVTKTSLAQTKNRRIYAFDDGTKAVHVKAEPNHNSLWSARGTVPCDGQAFIIAKGDDVVAVCIAGTDVGKMWISKNDAWSFDALPQITNGGTTITDVTTAIGGFGKVLIACTKDNGIWRLDGNGIWNWASSGLATGTHVYSITQKNNIYKNDRINDYIYIATNTGIYRSDDLGQNWFRIYEGGFSAIN
ncbi:MAG: hypothetical protein H6551_03420 [Chitinophagales bacterium]|nr:hypothetical protein [Chitinophagaceae bacterium]MCB9064174.1 hypothetical protein [Chitinophagales bacterium]